ncbi:MAG: dienelactone hydrolase family protein [Actinomycetota bacterium]|nr:dienelactone hydrolase family protein [Actinomycetota bacterium]
MVPAAFISLSCGGEPDGAAGTAQAASAVPGRQVALSFRGPNGRPLNYLLHLPRAYREGGRRWPVLLYLHGADLLGSGERGLRRLRRQGIPKVVDRRAEFPFIAVSPQTSTDWVPARLIALLDEIERRYAVDRRRVYATGFSLGGYGVWDLASAQPRRFAAIVPIAGGPSGRRAGCRLRTVALWAFHGTADDVVPASESRAMVRGMRRCAGKARLTLYPRAGHFIAERTYANPALYSWLAAHSRRAGGSGAPPQ